MAENDATMPDAAENGASRVGPTAFVNAGLQQIGIKREEVNPLGMEDFDWYVLGIFTSAGITVELLEVEDACREMMYEAVQIVDDAFLVEAVTRKDISETPLRVLRAAFC